ncbi:unnamed protein product [Rhizoctonia solani]|nr:unnamed protein product [Rhizoctonia solani]
MDLAWLRLQKLVRSEEAAIIKVDARYVDGAGRGLFATQDLSALETLVSVPGRLLLNARTLSNLYPEPILPQSISALEVNSLRLSSIQLLSLHLYRVKRGVKDVIFGAYIDTLPSSFSDHPIAIIQNPEIRSLLLKLVPVSVASMLLDVEQRLKDDWKLAMDILGKFPNMFPPGSKEEAGDPSFISEDYMWAWLNVNTRCLYHDLGFVQSSDNVTMCPILDFANHTSMYSLSITQGEFALGDEMAFSTSTPVKEGDQIYLRYGPHSNAFLFCEYGFVLPLDVKDARIADGEIVIDCDVEELLRNAKDFKLKEELLKDRNYWGLLLPPAIIMTQPIKTGVIGVGSSAVTFHVPFLLALPKLFVLHSVLERKATDDQKKKGGTIGSKFNISDISIANTLEEFLADPELQLVIITTPNETHYPFAKAALEAKKHVLLEKPVTPTYAEAKELDTLAKSQGVVLSAFQNRRWDSDFLTVKKLISEGKLGNLVDFESRFDRYRPSPRTTAFWREAAGQGAGHTFDLGPHLIDQVLQLFGRPNQLTASIQNLRGFGGPDVDDTFLIHFHYNSKPYPIRATVSASSLSVKKSQPRFNIRGSKGSYEKRGLDPQEDQLKARKVSILDAQFGQEDSSIAGVLDFVTENGTIESTSVPSEKGSYQSLFENLANAINSEADLQVKFEQSAAVIQMIELAMQSSKEGRTLDVPAP